MKMEKNIWTMLAAVSLTAGLLVGCGSSSESDDAGDAGTDVTTTDTALETAAETGTDGPLPFAITPGTYCWDITAIAPGFVDGCESGVETFVNKEAIPVNYDDTTGILKVGREGSLGQGKIDKNKGTLMRANMPVLMGMPLCTWTQTDDTMVEVIAENQITAAVVEKQSAFAAACAADAPAGGMCMSTFKWTLKITGTKTVQPDGNCK